jgi:hypothetical protein
LWIFRERNGNKKAASVEYRLLHNFILDNFPAKVKSECYFVLGSLYHVDVGSVADISEVYTASIFRVEVNSVSH